MGWVCITCTDASCSENYVITNLSSRTRALKPLTHHLNRTFLADFSRFNAEILKRTIFNLYRPMCTAVIVNPLQNSLQVHYSMHILGVLVVKQLTMKKYSTKCFLFFVGCRYDNEIITEKARDIGYCFARNELQMKATQADFGGLGG